MRRNRFGLLLAGIIGITVVASAAAQESKTSGTVSALSGDTMTIKAADGEKKFVVDAKTVLVASGAGTADRRAEAAGKPGPRLADFVKTGDNVEVTYREVSGTMHATNIRRVASLGGSGSGGAETSNGTVDAITATTLAISGSGGGGSKFKQTFTIDGATRVMAAGAGTAAARQGGKVPITDFVGVGDQVIVTYNKKGDTLHAEEVRVRAKKK
jgi:hypothetical protein